MTQIKRYEISIKSVSPIIWNRLKKENEDEKKKLKKNQLSEWEEENWLKKAELNNGNAVMPSEWIKSMLINSAKQTRIVPHFETKKNCTYTRYIGSVVIDKVKEVGKTKQLKPYGAYLGSQGANSKGKVYRIRPILENWKTDFVLVDPAGRMMKEELKEMLDYGGMFVGLGDSRINGFGRFEVDAIKEVN